MPAGRPSKYNEEVAGIIADLLAEGTPMKQICGKEGMPDYTTVLLWQRVHPEFSDLVARAKSDGTHALADECIEIADDKNIDPADKRVRIDTRLKLIGKWNSKAYGDKVEVASTGSVAVTHTLDVSNLSMEELDALEKALGRNG